ncbi:MAG TPA: antibiotic biosynthesis monooxygenase [Anaerolineales bacterium]|nr:antibiotic biosynthesis monooxygenase [Anaerolineales bacterium]
MHIVHVHVRVKPEALDGFTHATLANARKSVLEPGITRFDVIQNKDEPTQFTLVEVYRTEQDVDRHKATAHYATWVEAVADMLAEPRTRETYRNVYPEDPGWG